MSIKYRRAVTGDAVQAVDDFDIDATYAATAVKGDIVKLNASGEVVAAAADDTSVLGVFEGPIIQIDAETPIRGKVRTSGAAVYEMTASGGTPVVGTSYPIGLSSGDYFLNAAVTTNSLVKVIAERSNGNYDVIISGRQLG